MNLKSYADAWLSGEVCLHPTDTLPGLSFHPGSPRAEENFMAVKERPEDKRPISLIADWSIADRIWRPLPKGWDEILKNLWPASLSVIWFASESCPKSLVANDGSVALRMPTWTKDTIWMRDLLLELKEPFPSSSVNRSGEPPSESWEGAVAFALHAARKVNLPDWTPEKTPKDLHLRRLPSSVIRLDSDGGFAMLREGAVGRDLIDMERQRHAGVQRS